jgi:uncharacterized lipoprotein NlpE involved in copper resistance
MRTVHQFATLCALASGLALALMGCNAKHETPKPTPAELTPVPDGHPPIDPLPDPDLSGGHVGRAPRRITVAQLKSSIQVTSGRQWSQIDKLAASLGQADYALVNAEATEANLVFAKFLEDGAREVCLSAAQADLDQTSADKRVLSPVIPNDVKDLTKIDDASLGENLIYLSTRFWGQPLGDAELATWAASFKKMATAAEKAKKKREAWAAICIALMTDPRFTTY